MQILQQYHSSNTGFANPYYLILFVISPNNSHSLYCTSTQNALPTWNSPMFAQILSMISLPSLTTIINCSASIFFTESFNCLNQFPSTVSSVSQYDLTLNNHDFWADAKLNGNSADEIAPYSCQPIVVKDQILIIVYTHKDN
ncbi:Hypothetical_protein [Hexamita inflata]|uniref:Hypothetical_protein n=1 Tax=Hexamita inflata TaxID=28002 RepID=A0AA86N5I5_9EUKA|nr:Hypothetical protein HINF_LOCUS850 [Hexamita inflata]